MAFTYEPIATTTLSVATNTITFSSIPQTYTDLRLILNSRSSNTGTSSSGSRLRINGVSTSSYWDAYMSGYGGGTVSNAWGGAASNGIYYGETMQDGTTANTFSSQILDFYSYSSTSLVKTVFTFSAAKIPGSNGYNFNCIGNNKNTAAITSITLWPGSAGTADNFVAGTSATLYGILRA